MVVVASSGAPRGPGPPPPRRRRAPLPRPTSPLLLLPRTAASLPRSLRARQESASAAARLSSLEGLRLAPIGPRAKRDAIGGWRGARTQPIGLGAHLSPRPLRCLSLLLLQPPALARSPCPPACCCEWGASVLLLLGRAGLVPNSAGGGGGRAGPGPAAAPPPRPLLSSSAHTRGAQLSRPGPLQACSTCKTSSAGGGGGEGNLACLSQIRKGVLILVGEQQRN